MSTRHLGYLGGGALLAMIGLTVLGVPPEVWIPVTLVAAVMGLVLAVARARADGVEVAGRILAHHPSRRRPDAGTDAGAPARHHPSTGTRSSSDGGGGAHGRPVDSELVRPADGVTGVVEVWLHRCGGRRVHRFARAGGWVVQQVSTKDPDHPRKRVIGASFTFESEAEAVRAADDLARGITPVPAPTPTRRKRPSLTTADVRA
jgi:hypothetical protein